MTKNLTVAERKARQEAEAAMFRPSVKLVAPPQVRKDKVAYRYWKDNIERMKGVSLLDDLDTDILSQYCIQSSRRDALDEQYEETGSLDVLRLLQAQERIILQYASKLGLTAESRVRIAKRRADKRQIDPDGEMFD
jgi:phage terminase small subunit